MPGNVPSVPGFPGPYHDSQVNGNVSILAVGEGSGDDTNVSFRNVSQLSAVLTAFNGSQNIIGTNASILLSGCNAGVKIYDAYAIFETSIAQQISNKTQRGVYAYTVVLYFSQLDADHDPYVNGVGRNGPSGVPTYMVPEGAPGHKPKAVPFLPR
jgi:hypothetical protein